jgi:hypothetical protein
MVPAAQAELRYTMLYEKCQLKANITVLVEKGKEK